jgi:hypothetical protein
MGSALCTCPAGYRYSPPAPAPSSWGPPSAPAQQDTGTALQHLHHPHEVCPLHLPCSVQVPPLAPAPTSRDLPLHLPCRLQVPPFSTCTNLMGSALCTWPAGYRYCPPAPAPSSLDPPLHLPCTLQVLPSSTCTILMGTILQATGTTFPLDLYLLHEVLPLHIPSTGYRYCPGTCTNLIRSALCT